MAFSHQISIQLYTYGKFWSNVLDSPLYQCHPTDQLREYLFEEQCSSLQYRSGDLYNLFQGTIKLFWMVVVGQHRTKTLYCFFH